MSFEKTGIPKEIFHSGRGESSIYDTEIHEGSRFDKIIDEIRDKNGKLILDENGQPMPKVGWNEDKGFLTWHKSFPYPEKGWRDNASLRAVQYSKRILISWVRFLSFKKFMPCYIVLLLLPWKIKILEKWIDEFQESIELFLREFYLEDIYYSPITKEILIGVETFLNKLGVSGQKSECGPRSKVLARNLAMFVQFDTAYYYRFGDIMCEASKERMLKSPVKELKRLIDVIGARESRTHLVEKFSVFVRLLTLVLWIPKVRKAFKTAIEATRFERLKLDEEDKYNIRAGSVNEKEYKWFGMTLEERLAKWPPEQHLYYDYATGGLVTTDGIKK